MKYAAEKTSCRFRSACVVSGPAPPGTSSPVAGSTPICADVCNSVWVDASEARSRTACVLLATAGTRDMAAVITVRRWSVGDPVQYASTYAPKPGLAPKTVTVGGTANSRANSVSTAGQLVERFATTRSQCAARPASAFECAAKAVPNTVARFAIAWRVSFAAPQ